MTEKNFESIFKDTLGHYEADVNPSLWQSVQSGLAGKGAAVSGAAGASKAAGTFAGLGVKGMLWIASAVFVSGAGLYFWSGNQDATEKPVSKTGTESVKPLPAEPAATQDQPLVAAGPDKREIRDIKSDSRNTLNPAPVPAENKVQPEAKTSDPVAAPGIHSPVNQKAEGSGTASVSKTEEAVKTGTTAEMTSPLPEPSVLSVKASGEPSFDQIENYLMQTQSGDPRLPNHFTPDGDGINDVFTLQTTGLKSLEVTIFKQGGLIVAKWNDLHGSWNGVLPNGKNADAGTYYYSVTAVTAEGKICIAQSTLILGR